MTTATPALRGLVETFPGNLAMFAQEALVHDEDGAHLVVSKAAAGSRPYRSGAFASVGFFHHGRFDATSDFHLYTIDRRPGRITWLVNGSIVHERMGWDPTPLPHLPMRLHANPWAPRSEELAGRIDDALPTTATSEMSRCGPGSNDAARGIAQGQSEGQGPVAMMAVRGLYRRADPAGRSNELVGGGFTHAPRSAG